MKKLLLFLFIALTSIVKSQSLQSENFNSLNIGNIGTDLTGVTPGQGGWLTFNSTGGTNGNNDNYQIINVGGSNGNGLQLTGSNAATGNRFMWKNGLPAAWASRTSGNNIIEVEFDFNPSVASTSTNSFRIYLYSDETTAKVLAGIGIAGNTNIVSGFGHWTSTPGTGTYSFGLGPDAANPVVLTANTWVRLGFSFNKTTGEIRWKGPSFDASFTGNTAGGFPVVTAGIDPGEVDFLVVAGTANAVADVAFFDNLVVRASATNTLLGIKEISSTNTFSVYPNPSNDLVTISNDMNTVIESIEMIDLNGRVVKSHNINATEGQVSISDLATGVYMMKITTDQGTATKKVVKE